MTKKIEDAELAVALHLVARGKYQEAEKLLTKEILNQEMFFDAIPLGQTVFAAAVYAAEDLDFVKRLVQKGADVTKLTEFDFGEMRRRLFKLAQEKVETRRQYEQLGYIFDIKELPPFDETRDGIMLRKLSKSRSDIFQYLKAEQKRVLEYSGQLNEQGNSKKKTKPVAKTTKKKTKGLSTLRKALPSKTKNVSGNKR